MNFYQRNFELLLIVGVTTAFSPLICVVLGIRWLGI